MKRPKIKAKPVLVSCQAGLARCGLARGVAPIAALALFLSIFLPLPLFAQDAVAPTASPIVVAPGTATLPLPDPRAPKWATRLPHAARPIGGETRWRLTSEYSRIHYGIDDWYIRGPLAVVVHFTGTDSLAGSLASFTADELPGARPDIASGGRLNVGVHYVIARDGTIYTLLPEYAMGRHAIGYNKIALGIELVGAAPSSLSPAQLEACVALVADMAARHPELRYLFGHHEYEQAGRAHAALRLELDSGYAPTVKIDPGASFMDALRAALAARHALAFQD